ncbi:ABCD1 [Symbiodinium necroappetens]|uniref:ABCD1 protein n=1 Tax=Symbiodinium necroappetens TaxID=1628268 RepID=A0A812RBI1_9DINO|nr:ABCD1 [Symbiodinium necroappetens]
MTQPLVAQLYVWYEALKLVMRYTTDNHQLRRQFLVLGLASVVRTGTLVAKMRMNEMQVYYQNSGQLRKWVRSMIDGILACAVIAGLTSWHSYAEKALARMWRQALTTRLHQLYFASSHFYQIAQGGEAEGAVVDADVRLTSDVPALASSVSSLLSQMLGGVVDVIAFSVILARQGRRGILFAVATQIYGISLYITANYIMPVDWAGLLGGAAATDSALKQSLSRAETHAQAICAMQGGPPELRDFNGKLRAALAAKWRAYVGQDRLDTLLYYFIFSCLEQSPLGWLTYLWGVSSLMAGRSVRVGNEASRVLGYTERSHVVAEGYSRGIQLFWGGNFLLWATFRIVFALHQVLQNYAAIMRIQHLEKKLVATAKPPVRVNVSPEDRIEFKDVSIHTPSNALLVDRLSFSVRWGEALLLTGHNGSGKSSIFRCLGGLWMIQNGSIVRPRNHTDNDNDEIGLTGVVYYLPQRPYNALGTLMDQFCYPDPVPETLTEKELRRWLDFVDLGHLADYPGVFSEQIDWEQVLSRGEQQRLAILRLFWRRPKFAVLDECTSAVSGEMERRLFELCPKLGISCITIAHRPALLQYHQQQLMLTGKPTENGGWSLKKIDDGATTFDPEASKNIDAAGLIESYMAGRAIKLSEARKTECAEIAQERSRKFEECSTRSLLPQERQTRIYHPALFTGLRQPAAVGRLAALVLCLVVRCPLLLAAWRSVGEIIVSALSGDVAFIRRAFWKNMKLSMLTLVLDRLIKRLSQRLAMLVQEGLSLKVHELLLRKHAIHHGMAWQLPATQPPAARTAEVAGFGDALLGFMESSLKPCVLAFYGAALSLFTGGWRVLVLYLLNMPLHGLISRYVMPNYAVHMGGLADKEAKFKTVHARFRQNLEPIAFSGGGRAEQRIIEERFDDVIKTQHALDNEDILYQAATDFLTNGSLLPLSFMRVLSMYYTMKNSSAVSQGAISPAELYGMWAFDRGTTLAFNNMSAVCRLPERLIGLHFTLARISEFLNGLEQAERLAPNVATAQNVADEPVLKVRDLDILTPGKDEVLALRVGFEVKPGNPVVITGPNASGKSLLAGHLAGLRAPSTVNASVTFCGSSVFRTRPFLHDLLLIPQKPYLAPGGLGDQVSYPLSGSEQDPKKLQQALDVVGIGYLVDRHGGLFTTPGLQWDEILSGGEQQRIGIARCLFHCPRLAILDECTSMVSQDTEVQLYKAIAEAGCVPITISQRLTLPEIHEQELQLGCDSLAGWSLQACQ